MYLVITRTFRPELGGMQNLMWGLTRSLSKLNLIKVFADYHENHEEFDNTVSFSIERVSGMKLIRKYRKSCPAVSRKPYKVTSCTLVDNFGRPLGASSFTNPSSVKPRGASSLLSPINTV